MISYYLQGSATSDYRTWHFVLPEDGTLELKHVRYTSLMFIYN